MGVGFAAWDQSSRARSPLFPLAVPTLWPCPPTSDASHALPSHLPTHSVQVRGKDVPKPVRNWNQCGLSSRVLETLRRNGMDVPTPIQAQALPAIMSGRDVIGIAKTGSGKTLAFVLPALRHIKDQRPLEQGDGPVVLGLAPTRELCVQIGKDVKRFARPLGLTCVCAYGGSALGTQISDLKRGAEIVIATPGRLIDVLAASCSNVLGRTGGGERGMYFGGLVWTRGCPNRRTADRPTPPATSTADDPCPTAADHPRPHRPLSTLPPHPPPTQMSNGKITNLRRVTYLVLDEADRMFDMGFEPQITRITSLVRPDRQTVMFSATFPRQVEALARRLLASPVEILVGGRSVVNADITQYVEVREPDDRFLRLLEILGEWYERGKVLVFVASQDGCDNLFRDLLKASRVLFSSKKHVSSGRRRAWRGV